MERLLDHGERRLGAVGLGHLAQARPVPSTEPQRGPEPLAQLAQRDSGHVVVLEQVDHEPLRGGVRWEIHATQQKAPPIERDLARPARVVDQGCREHRRRPKPECVPLRRTGHEEGLTAEEGAEQLLVGRGRRAKLGEARREIKTAGSLLQFPLGHEASREPRRVRAPSTKVPGAIGAARLQFGLCGGAHGYVWKKSTVGNIRCVPAWMQARSSATHVDDLRGDVANRVFSYERKKFVLEWAGSLVRDLTERTYLG